jgi:integrase
VTDRKLRPRAKGTGSVYRPKGSRYYWIAYISGGQRFFESTKMLTKSAAQDVLTRKLGDISHGLHVTPKVGKKTLREGLAAVITNLTVNGRRSVAETERHIDRHVLKFFHPDKRMANISTADLEAYVQHRLGAGAAAASCNNELATIRRAFRLAMRAAELASMPHIPMLALNNARKGFLERAELDAILKHAPDFVYDPLVFAFITGWRVHSEVMPLRVEQVDLGVGVVRLEPGTTKNKEGRSFYLTRELREILTRRVESIERLRETGVICPFVFHRPDGSHIKNMRHYWDDARAAAGYPHKLLHDFRRSAVRALERSSVPRSTAMAMVGHKTEAIYRRYAIVDEAMHREAASKLDAWAEQQKGRCAEAKGLLKQFARGTEPAREPTPKAEAV